MPERRTGRRVGAAFALMMTAAAPALAGEPGPAADLWSAPLSGRMPADSGKPAILVPPVGVGPAGADRCVPALPCGTRLLGSVRRNGAVEIQVPALRW